MALSAIVLAIERWETELPDCIKMSLNTSWMRRGLQRLASLKWSGNCLTTINGPCLWMWCIAVVMRWWVRSMSCMNIRLYRQIIFVISIVIFSILIVILALSILTVTVLVTWRRRSLIMMMCQLLGLLSLCLCLAALLPLSAFHFCLLQQPTSFSLLFPCFTIFDLVLSDQCYWRRTKYSLILAKLTDPHLSQSGRVVEIAKLLLLTTCSGGNQILLPRLPPYPRWLSWGCGLFLRIVAMLRSRIALTRACWRDSIVNATRHVRRRLCSLVYPCCSGIYSGQTGCWPRNSSGYLRVTSESELRCGRWFLRSLLMK